MMLCAARQQPRKSHREEEKSWTLFFAVASTVQARHNTFAASQEMGLLMKFSLVVLTVGRMEGKSISIALPEFVIGRDPQCQLRPASALISKRHCALIQRDGKAFVVDFGSTNGTYLNDERVEGERPLQQGDRLKIGPLEFRVELELPEVVEQAPPAPATMAASEDEAAAAMLLSLRDDGSPMPSSPGVDSEGVPTGSTVMETFPPPVDAPSAQVKGGASDREKAAKTAQGNTSNAAKAILEKYMRRPKS
jgi:pSer/pThr/pTyr-binding forkhead associated (FHA) protein